MAARSCDGTVAGHHGPSLSWRRVAVGIVVLLATVGIQHSVVEASTPYCLNRVETSAIGVGGISDSLFEVRGCTFTNTFEFGDFALRNSRILIHGCNFTSGLVLKAVIMSNVSIAMRNTTVSATGGPNAHAFVFDQSVVSSSNVTVAIMNSSITATSPGRAEALTLGLNDCINCTVSVRNAVVLASAPSTMAGNFGGYIGGGTVTIDNSTFKALHMSTGFATSSRTRSLSFNRMTDSSLFISRTIAEAFTTRHGSQRASVLEFGGDVVNGNVTVSDGCMLKATIFATPSGVEEVNAATLYFGGRVGNGSTVSVSNSSVEAMCPYITAAFTFVGGIDNSSVVFRQGTLRAGPSMHESTCLHSRERFDSVHATIADVNYLGCASARWTPAARITNATVYARCNSNNGDTANAWQASTYGAGTGSSVTLVPCGQCQPLLDCFEPNTISVSPVLAPFDCACTCNLTKLPPMPARRTVTFDQRCYMVPRAYNPALSMSISRTRSRATQSPSKGTVSIAASKSAHASSRTATAAASRSRTFSARTASASTTRTVRTSTQSKALGESKTKHATSRTASPTASRLPPAVSTSVLSNALIPSSAVTNGSNASIFARTALVEVASSDSQVPTQLTASATTTAGLTVTPRYVFVANSTVNGVWDAARTAAADRAIKAVVGSAVSNRVIAFEVRPSVFDSVANAREVLHEGAEQLVLRFSFDRKTAFRPIPRSVATFDLVVEPVFPNGTAPTSVPGAAPDMAPTRSSTPLDIVSFASIAVMAVLARPAPAMSLLRHRFLLFHRYSTGGSGAAVYRGPRPLPDAVIVDAQINVGSDADGEPGTPTDSFTTAAAVYNTGLMLACFVVAGGIAAVVVLKSANRANGSSSSDSLAKAEEALLDERNDDDDGDDRAIAARARREAAEEGRVRIALGSARFVPMLLAPIVLLYQPTVAAAALLVVEGLDGQSRLLGGIIMGTASLPVAALLYLSVGRRFAAQFLRTFQRSASGAAATSEFQHRQPVPVALSLFAQRDGAWQNAAARRAGHALDDERTDDPEARYDGANDAVAPALQGAGFVECYGAVFAPFRGGRHWFLAIEVLATLVFAFAGAIADRTATPAAGAAVLLVCGVAMTAATAALRPCRQAADQVLLVVGEVTMLVAGGSYVAAASDPDNKAIAAVAQGFVSAVQGLTVLRAIFDIANVVVAHKYGVDEAILRSAQRREEELASASNGRQLDTFRECRSYRTPLPNHHRRTSSTDVRTRPGPRPTPDMSMNARPNATDFADDDTDVPTGPPPQPIIAAGAGSSAPQDPFGDPAAMAPATSSRASGAGAASPALDPLLADMLDVPPRSTRHSRAPSHTGGLSDDDEL